ncbi:MAG: arsenate reductase (glutaredoxin) [Salinivirgaceae bacterium]
MLTIYHNPRCAKSRAGLQYLTENNLPHQVITYLKMPLTANDIQNLANKTGVRPKDLVRTQEKFYKTDLKGKNFSDEQWCRIIADNPALLQRPIVLSGEKGVLAQPPEKINELL